MYRELTKFVSLYIIFMLRNTRKERKVRIKKKIIFGICLVSMIGMMGFTAYAVIKQGSFKSTDGKTTANYCDTVTWNLLSKDVGGGWTQIDASSSVLDRTTLIVIQAYNNNSIVNGVTGKGFTTVQKELSANADEFVFSHQILAANQSTPVATKKVVTIAY